MPEAPTQQLTLAEALGIKTPVPPVESPTRLIPAHARKSTRSKAEDRAESVPFFGADQVPVMTIEVPNPEIAGLTPEQYTVIGTRETYRLAQQPGSYVVIQIVRPVIKRLDTQSIHCASAPVGVLEGSRADASFAAGMVVDKFLYHLPIYRIHQRLQDSGFNLSRPWLTQLMQQIVGLLEPIHDAQFASIRASRVKAMDETPIKANLKGPGKMKQEYFWPVYGEQDEICFPYCESRRAEHVDHLFGLTAGVDITLKNQLDSLESVSILAGSRLHIDTESGLVHVAASLGNRSIVIFGPTNVAWFGYPQNINIAPKQRGNCWWSTNSWMDVCAGGHEIPICTSEASIAPVDVAMHAINVLDNQTVTQPTSVGIKKNDVSHA
ncbi:transposase [Acidithiobacillus sp.]|uniref:IS66 family transposase n=1 Tax=Acidithiobacillus sp. TaxID=1872118 RepID=UPI00258DC38B|nr:transposase [Acidithiobacillus sp.]MDD5375555.1 transposase [Acidithiobacillus sp.]